MKKYFIKDDRIGEIEDYKLEQIMKLQKKGKLNGFYSSELSWRKRNINKYPGYVCEYGWEITDPETGYEIDDLDNIQINIKKDGDYFCAECEAFFTENVINSHMSCGKTFEGTLKKFIKELRDERKTLCLRGTAIEGEIEKAIYEDKEKE